MSVRLEALLARVPEEAGDRVDKARIRWNRPIREMLRQETGLRLNRAEATRGSGAQQSLVDSVGVPIKVLPGLPEKLKSVEFDDVMDLRVLIGRWRTTLGMLLEGATETQQLVRELESEGHAQRLVRQRGVHLREAAELAEELLRELGQEDPVTKILEVNADVLGVYAYYLPEQQTLQDAGVPTGVRVELYWGVIGLIAELLGRSVESLTVVVLAHELAHAYTHLACDIDDHRWGARAFATSQHELKEGLAQYYAERVCERLRGEFADAIETYKLLLPKQPKAYRTHEVWIKDFQPEEIRFAMIETRRRGIGRLEEFQAALEDMRDRLREGQTT
jgi:hypothetical protein